MVQQGSEYSLEVCQPLPNRNIRLYLRDSPKSTFSPELQISKNGEASQILNIFCKRLSLKMKNAKFCFVGGLKLHEKPKNLKNNLFRTNLNHFQRVKISFLRNISLFEKVQFTEIQNCQYFQKFWNFFAFLAFKSKKGIFFTGKTIFSLKLDPQQSRIWHFSFSKTIFCKIY